MIKVVPIFVAAMVWLIRVLIIGTFSVDGERLFTLADVHDRYSSQRNYPAQTQQPAYRPNQPSTNTPRPAPKPTPNYGTNRPVAEPTYHPIGMTAMGANEQNTSSMRR
jgi:hypothetical protein